MRTRGSNIGYGRDDLTHLGPSCPICGREDYTAGARNCGCEPYDCSVCGKTLAAAWDPPDEQERCPRCARDEAYRCARCQEVYYGREPDSWASLRGWCPFCEEKYGGWP